MGMLERIVARKMEFGQCRLCGDETLLSYEHVPPRVTFNRGTYVEKDIKDFIGPGSRDWDEPPDRRGKQIQGGNGGKWLCPPCNSFLGREYVPEYSNMVRRLVEGVPNEDDEIVLEGIRLKRVFKQVIGMFCAINASGPEWPNVVRFVREPEEPRLPDGLRVFIFTCYGPSIHLYGFQGVVKARTGTAMVSEITHPPMGFHLVHADPWEPNPKMAEITSWQKFALDEPVKSVSFTLPSLPVFSPMPNDFRTPDEMRETRSENESRQALRSMGWWIP